MKRTRNRKRINDAIKLFKLPQSLLAGIRTASLREGVSASKLIRTAAVRLLADLKNGVDVEWR
jgi:hypothetical protein